ncbi:ATP-binding protein [Pseudomonas sp. A-1]|uniref:sensor histidine kinase n=1 Tax=Pseudomonas sp. A-1 TaxID=1821274 RepID=UPI001C49B947|nr:ATP-binding protein [Pseudomonas sp. A-1]
MDNRHILLQACLHTLAFALLAGGGLGLLDTLLRPAPALHPLMLPGSSMAHLGLGLLAASLASLVSLWLWHGQPASRDGRLDRRTLLAGLGAVLLSIGSWYLLGLQNARSLTDQSDLLLSRLDNASHEAIASRLALLQRMGERWEALGQLPAPTFWLQETDSYLRDLPGFTLIALLDERLQVSRSQTRMPSAGAWLDSFIADPARQAWLEQVRGGREPRLSPALLRPGTPPMALVAVPLHLPGEPVRLVVASLDLHHALAELLAGGTGDFVVEVREGEQLLLGGTAGDTPRATPVGTREIDLARAPRWTLTTYLNDARDTADSQRLALLVLLGGLLLSGLLMFSLRLAWLAQRQAGRLAEQQRYTEGQRHILGMISTLQPAELILREICLLIEQQAPGVLSSVYQVDPSGQRLTLGAAPSLGERYSQAIASLPIGEDIGACGTAAYRRQPVLVEDIPHDRRWKGFHQLAAAEGLYSCWSTPLLAGNGELLGTFAIYRRQPMHVDAELQALVATASQLAAVAIEHRNTLAELERSNRELEEFAFVASHDLQEPLRKIQTFADRLTSHASGLDEQGRDYLQRMGAAAGRMQALIRDLLAYSRLNTRRQPFVPVALDPLLDEVLQDLEGTLECSGAQLQREPLPMVHGDPSQLRQLLQNLLSNALKFHKPGEAPVIRIYAERQGSGEWSLCISDRGIGFDEKYLERIFQPFQRLHGRQAYPGTGIGLAIARKIAERHGARLTARSQPGQGACFCVTFHRSDKE